MRAAPLLLLLPLLTCCLGNRTLVARRKRSLTFPKGSAFVMTVALIKPIQLKEPANWNLDLEFDMIWPIPAGVDAYRPKPSWPPSYRPHRRHRREIYANLESALDSQGLPGSRCLLRSICEAKLLLNPPGVSLVEDLIRVLLSYPSEGGSVLDAYDEAHSRLSDCDLAYPCPLSLLDFLLNYKSHVLK